MQVNRMGPIGAEILDIDVKAMDESIFAKIY